MPHADDIAILRHRFNEIDALAEAARHWQIDFHQLDRGGFLGEMGQVSADSVTVIHCQFNRRLQQLGSAPPGCRTFAVPLRDHTPLAWRGHEVLSGDLMGFGSDVEMSAISLPGFHVFAVSIGEELLVDAAQGLGFDSYEEILTREQVVRCPAGPLGALREFCSRATGSSPVTPASRLALAEALRYELPSLMLQGFLPGERKLPRPVSFDRQRGLRLALEVIRDAREPICRVSDLCRLTGAGERTLRYAFAETFGVSPKSYLQSLRLNAVRRELLQGREDTVIADVANHQGFWHMGQFAADYRRMFGELPSVTLKRVYQRAENVDCAGRSAPSVR